MKSPAVQRGFTLLEVMVVVIVITIMAGISVFALNQASDRRYHHEAEKLSDWLQQLADIALLENSNYGLLIDEKQVVALVNYDTLWIPATLPNPFLLSDDASITLTDSYTPVFSGQELTLTEDEMPLPQLIITPGGILFPVNELQLEFSSFEEQFIYSMDEVLTEIIVRRAAS